MKGIRKWSKGSYVLGQKRREKMVKGFPLAVALLMAVLTSVLVLNPQARALGGTERIAYYGNWDIYGNDYSLKKVNDSGAAGRLTTLVYSFENISPTTLKCFQDISPVDESPTTESNPSAGDGGADAWADYQRPFAANESVNGTADSNTQALRGNFNQLKQLKQKHPGLKVFLSIGGWSFSKYFSDAAQPANRAAFVSSCIDMYIKGNLPTGVKGDTTAGGNGVAAGIFDGIDIDWEFPGSANGHVGNHTSPSDTANYTSLMAEFRSQLNAVTSTTGKYYYLTAAVPSGGNDIDKIQASSVKNYLDWVGVMSYDMHGAWEDHTNFQGPQHVSPNDPDASMGFTVDQAMQHWQNNGMPLSKLSMGVPFYWRGWSGVPAGTNHGLYQPAAGASPAFGTSKVPGEAHFKELLAAGKFNSGTYSDPITGAPWIYDGSNFWTGDTPTSASQKGTTIRNAGYKGAMVYSLESDDASGTMLKSLVNGLNGGAPPASTTIAVLTSGSRTAPSSPNTATNGEPINMIGGNYLASRHELSLPGKDSPVDYSLSYNSALGSEDGVNGWGWTNSLRITAATNDDNTVIVQNPDGRMDQYTPNGSGGYTAPQGIFDTLSVVGTNFKVTHKDKSVYNFNATGLISSAVSPNGNTTTFTYDADNYLTQVTDSAGRHLNFTYNDDHQVATATDPAGRVVTYTYDALGNLTSVKNPANQVTQYEYDADHHITKVTDPRGNAVVNNVYDAQGRVIQQTNGLNKTVSLDYSTPGKTVYTDANGGTTQYFYDSSLRLTSVVDALGHTTTTTYDANGNRSGVTDANNHTTGYTYDSRGNLTQITDAASGTQTFTYDSNDNLLTRTDQLGHVTTYTYDSNGNVLTSKDPLNKTTTFAYDAAGQMTSVTDPLNNLTGFVYDANGNRVTSTDASNRNTYYGYDSIGRLTAVEDADEDETDYTLDAMNHVTKATLSSGKETNYVYDADGNKTKVTDANNHATNYVYDANNNLTKTTDAKNNATTYAYDGNDNLTSKTDAKNHTTSYTYDLLNRQTQTTDPVSNVSKVVYDNVGNVIQRIDASNRTTTYAYDALNRLVTTTYPDSTTATNTYDAAGNLLTATNASGTTTYTYDNDNRMLTSKDPHNATVTYTYNAAGGLTQMKYPDNKIVTYTYTPSNQLSTAKDWNNSTTTYLYDNEGRVATKTYPNTIKATYSYDEDGNLDSLTYKKGTAAFTQYNYTRDSVGNITEEEELKAGSSAKYHDYTYDAVNQVTQDDAPTDTYNYTYDAVGNMATSQNGSGTTTYNSNNANQLTGTTGASVRNFTYDPQGNEVSDTSKTLAYNYDNQLKTYTSGSSVTGFVYDATGNRIEKNITGGTSYQYVNTGNNQVLVAKNMTASTNQYYVYGVDQISQGDTASSSRQYFLTDGMGNVRYVTNSSGAVVTNGTDTYDTYGKQLTGNSTVSNYAYQDEQKDAETGLTYLRARYYDPTIGRFTAKDPLAGAPDDLASQNGYGYVEGNPINMYDPLGLSAWSSFKDITGLTKYENSIAQGCSIGSIVNNGLTAAANLSLLIPGLGEADAAAQGTLRGAEALTKAEQLALNAKNGKAAESLVERQLQSLYGESNVQSQVYNKVPGLGARRSDFMVNGPDGSFLVEVKSGAAKYGGVQAQKDQWIEQNLGLPTQLIRIP